MAREKFYKKKSWPARSWAVGKDKKTLVQPQFLCQPSKYVQRMAAADEKAENVLLRHEKGADLKSCDKAWKWQNRKAIARQLANAIIDMNLTYNVMHRDLHYLQPENIIAERTQSGRPKIKIIDFRGSERINHETASLSDFRTDYYQMKENLRDLCLTEKEFKELSDYFEGYYKKRVKEKF
ncbi:MAG: hypothetical protein V1911_02280 [Candidatus Micrarchaeota archaeon]